MGRPSAGPSFIIEVLKNALSGLSPVREWFERLSARRSREAEDFSRPFTLWQELQARTRGQLSVEGQEVLEIGPGKSLGLCLIFLAAGARRVFAFDRFRHLFWDDLDRAHLAHVLDRISREGWPGAAAARRAVRQIRRGEATFDPDLLVYGHADGAGLPLDGASVDLSYSNAVLEHVHRPAEVVRELARVTRRGGSTIHEIDFRDHFVEVNRLRMLAFTEAEWQLRARLRPGYTNRLRLSDFVSLFADAGFSLLNGQPTNQTSDQEVEGLRDGLADHFRERPTADLTTLSFWGWWRRL